jgi:hypothetical protein
MKLWRSLAEHPVWLGERFTRGQAWVDLLMHAAHEEHQVVRGGRARTVPRGAVLTSQLALAKRWRWDRKTVVRFLRLLISLDMIRDISAVRGAGIGYTLLTLKNYARFQSDTRATLDISTDISRPISRPTGEDFQRDIYAPFTPHAEEGLRRIKKERSARARSRISIDHSQNGVGKSVDRRSEP